MKYSLAALALFFLPLSALAASTVPSPATFLADRNLVVASTSSANLYAAGAAVALTTPVSGEATLLGGTVLVAGSVGSDALLLGGSVTVHAPIKGNLRLLAVRSLITAPVSGDLVAVALSFNDAAAGERDAFIAAEEATLSGSSGPVTIYSNNVALSGTYNGDVHVIAAGRVALAENTVINGTLDYQSPEAAVIPNSAKISGGATYEGASYLPSSTQARAIALAGFGVFLFVKVLGMLILAGLLAGLFPRLSEEVIAQTMPDEAQSAALSTLLGFAILVATPIFLLFLAITFVGIGLALLVFAAYFLLTLLAFGYAGTVIGSLLQRVIGRFEPVYWRDAVIGMLILSLVWLIPIVGWIIVFLLLSFTAGTLVRLFYHFAFPRPRETPLL